jgi:phospholipid transport system substrate-binding protein
MKSIIALCFALLLFNQSIFADVKTDVRELVVKTVDAVVDMIKNETIEKNEKHQKIIKLLKPMIDYVNFGKRSLGKDKNNKAKFDRFSKKQKRYFVKYFSKRENNFMVDVLDKYTDEKVKYGEVTIVSDKRVKMKLLIESSDSDNEVELFFSYSERLKRWRAYDIIVEGIERSKTNNNQFNAMIREYKTINKFLQALKKLSEIAPVKK